MGRPRRIWVVSATAAAGVIGGGLAAVAATGGADHQPASPPAPAKVADPAVTAEVAALRSRISTLLAEERRLHHTAARARHHLRLQAAAAQAAAQRAAQQSAVAATPQQPAPVRAAPVAAAPAPVATHTTSGASGAHRSGGDGEGEHEGHDD